MDSWREDKTEVILASLNFYKKKKKKKYMLHNSQTNTL